jgi:integrase
MASVSKRDGSPLWAASYYVDGKRYRFTTTSRNRRDAQKEADAAEEATRLELKNAGGLRLIEAASLFFKLNKKLKPKTVQGYKKSLSNVYEVMGDFAIASITNDDIKRFVTKRLESTSSIVVRRDLAFMSSVYHYVDNLEVRLTSNPWRAYNKKGLPEAVQRTTFLSDNEVQKLLDLCNQQLHRCLITLAVDTGMRRNELLKLHVDEIDLNERQIYLGNRSRDRTKGGTGRVIPLTSRAVAEIETLLETHRKSHGKSQPGKGAIQWNGHLFENYATGKPVTDVKTFWQRVTKAAGLQGVRLHDLRHTFCTAGLAAGASQVSLMGISGHRSIQSFKRYAHATDASKRLAIQMMESHKKDNRPDL